MILFVGDTHGDFDLPLEAAERLQPAAIVLLGDQCPRKPLELVLGEWADRTWFIPGNHDSDLPEWYENHSGMLDRDLTGRVKVIDGRAVAGLGGVFRGQIWFPPEPPRWETREEFVRHCRKPHRYKGGLPLRHLTSIWPEDVEKLQGLRNVDILATHEAPESHGHGNRALGDLARALGVKVHVHGHHHSRYTAWLDGVEGRGLIRVEGLDMPSWGDVENGVFAY